MRQDRFGERDLSGGTVAFGDGTIEFEFRGGVAIDGFARALERGFCELLACFADGNFGLGLFDGGLERARVDAEKQVADFDGCAVDNVLFLNEAANAGADFDGFDATNGAGEIERERNGLRDGRSDGDFRWRRRRGGLAFGFTGCQGSEGEGKYCEIGEEANRVDRP